MMLWCNTSEWSCIRARRCEGRIWERRVWPEAHSLRDTNTLILRPDRIIITDGLNQSSSLAYIKICMHVLMCVCVCVCVCERERQTIHVSEANHGWGLKGGKKNTSRSLRHAQKRKVEPAINFLPGFIITWMIKVGQFWWGVCLTDEEPYAGLMEEVSDSPD